MRQGGLPAGANPGLECGGRLGSPSRWRSPAGRRGGAPAGGLRCRCGIDFVAIGIFIFSVARLMKAVLQAAKAAGVADRRDRDATTAREFIGGGRAGGRGGPIRCGSPALSRTVPACGVRSR